MLDVITYRPLSTCPFDDAVRAWNDGFAGYYSDMTIAVAGFESRIRQDGITPEASILAYAGQRPVGIILNAIADVHSVRQAWNGGTAVATDFRGTGVAREMLRRAHGLYSERGVRLATLEAMAQNARAIALYAKLGYRHSGALLGLGAKKPQIESVTAAVDVEFVAPERLTSVPFYRKRAAWSTLWPNARGAVAVIASRSGAPAAFVLFRRAMLKESGAPQIRILQLECADDGSALRAALGALFAHHRDVAEYLAYNIPTSNDVGLGVLREAGFQPSWEQVWMRREFVT